MPRRGPAWTWTSARARPGFAPTPRGMPCTPQGLRDAARAHSPVSQCCALDAHVQTQRGATLRLRAAMIRPPCSNAVRPRGNAVPPHSNAASPRSNTVGPHSNALSPRSNAVLSAQEPFALRVAMLRRRETMLRLCIAMLPIRAAMLRPGVAVLHAPRSNAAPRRVHAPCFV